MKTVNKENESENIENIVSFLFTERENLNPIIINKKKIKTCQVWQTKKYRFIKLE